MPASCGADMVYLIVKIGAVIAMLLTLRAVQFFFFFWKQLSFNQIKIASNAFVPDLFSSVNMEEIFIRHPLKFKHEHCD